MKQNITTVGIDLANKIFHLVGTDATGKLVWRKQLTRHALLPCMAPLPPVPIGLEACGGAHDWARQWCPQGHTVQRMAPQFVQPYVKANKNDRRDAEAMAEAVTRPTMRFVPRKDIAQHDVQALHRVRERLIGARTAFSNAVHGLLHAYGIVLPTGGTTFRQAVVEQLESAKAKRTALRQEMFWQLVEECVALAEQLPSYQGQRDTLAVPHPACQRLLTVPGLGPVTATALVAAGGEVGVLKHGRQLAAW